MFLIIRFLKHFFIPVDKSEEEELDKCSGEEQASWKKEVVETVRWRARIGQLTFCMQAPLKRYLFIFMLFVTFRGVRARFNTYKFKSTHKSQNLDSSYGKHFQNAFQAGVNFIVLSSESVISLLENVICFPAETLNFTSLKHDISRIKAEIIPCFLTLAW